MDDDYEMTGFVGDFIFENEIKIPMLSLKNVTVYDLDLRTRQGCNANTINSFIDKMHGVLLSRTIEQNYQLQFYCLAEVGFVEWNGLDFLHSSSPEINTTGINEFIDKIKELIHTSIESPNIKLLN
jgi:hypothetical protein